MSFLTILLISIALGTDAFSLAICVGLDNRNKKTLYLLPLVIAVFHVFMPLIGLWLGDLLWRSAGKIAGYLGAIILILIGIQMFREAWKSRAEHESCQYSKKSVLAGTGAIILAAASVSIDALTAGLSLGVIHVDLALTVITMGIVAGLMTLAGFSLGGKLGARLGEKAQFFGGTVLIIIGINMFF